MPRVVSFIVLLAILLVTGAVFFRVMQSFVVPLFLAGVLVVIFEPFYDWLRRKMPGRRKLAALLMTAGVLLVVLLPTCWLFLHAYAECSGLIETLRDSHLLRAEDVFAELDLSWDLDRLKQVRG